MKKRTRILGIILVLALIVTSFASTAAFAEETNPTTFTFTDGFESVTTVGLNTVHYYEVVVSNPELTLTAKSSDNSVVYIQMEALGEGDYMFALSAVKNGEATVTFTASDDTSVSQNITVEGTGERNYTISSDIMGDFTLAKGAAVWSRFIMKAMILITFLFRSWRRMIRKTACKPNYSI